MRHLDPLFLLLGPAAFLVGYLMFDPLRALVKRPAVATFIDFIDYWAAPLQVVLLIALAPGRSSLLDFLVAWAAWTLFEYWLHRGVFHEYFFRPVWKGHMDHHRNPQKIQGLRMVTPLITVAFTYVTLRYCPNASLLVAGFLFGYWGYLVIHWMFHEFSPPPVLRRVWVRHEIHHHQNANLWYGLTTNLWDHVFGTAGPVYERRHVPGSGTEPDVEPSLEERARKGH